MRSLACLHGFGGEKVRFVPFRWRDVVGMILVMFIVLSLRNVALCYEDLLIEGRPQRLE